MNYIPKKNEHNYLSQLVIFDYGLPVLYYNFYRKNVILSI